MTNQEFHELRPGDKVMISGNAKAKGVVCYVLRLPGLCGTAIIVSGGTGRYSYRTLRKLVNF